MSVWRYDLARFSPATQLTPQGFLKAPANFTKAGVFEYDRTDGTKVRELRPDEEVFHEDSLSTLRGAPVTNDHPKAGMVTPTNATTLTVGWAGETVERSDAYVSGSVTVMDSDTIQRIRSGDLREISMGYRCSIEHTAGEHPVYGRYDQIQRNIRYNHVAIGAPDWGRAGSDVALRLDSTAAWSGTGVDNSPEKDVDSGKAPTSRRDAIMETMTIKIGGVEFDVPKQAAQALQTDFARRDTELATVRADAEATQGRFDAQAAELKNVKKQLAEAQDPERFDSALKEHAELTAKARRVLGDEAEMPTTKREIWEKVLRKDNADLDLTAKSDDYVEARFDHMIETAKTAPQAPKPGQGRADARNAAQQNGSDEKRFDAAAARARMLEANANAWQQPLAVSSQRE
jgi:hypothetical protein